MKPDDAAATTAPSRSLADLALGSSLFWFDPNRRVYKKDASGMSTGGPIWREHWRKVEVIGETPRMWLLSGYAGKIPKKGPLPQGICLDEGEIDRAEWVENHKHKLVFHLSHFVRDYETLRKIAEISGYKIDDKA